MNTLLTARSIRNILISAAAVSAITLPIFAIASGESLDVDFNVESQVKLARIRKGGNDEEAR